MRKLLIGGVLALVLGCWLATPWLALHELRDAARAGDAERLNDMVDFSELRESVRLNLLERVARSDDGHAGSRARALGAAVAGALLGPMIDAVITPDAVASLLRSQRPQGAVWHATSAGQEQLRANSHYESLNRFVVSLRPAEGANDEDPIQLVFHRDGMFNWKLAELRLP